MTPGGVAGPLTRGSLGSLGGGGGVGCAVGRRRPTEHARAVPPHVLPARRPRAARDPRSPRLRCSCSPAAAGVVLDALTLPGARGLGACPLAPTGAFDDSMALPGLMGVGGVSLADAPRDRAGGWSVEPPMPSPTPPPGVGRGRAPRGEGVLDGGRVVVSGTTCPPSGAPPGVLRGRGLPVPPPAASGGGPPPTLPGPC